MPQVAHALNRLVIVALPALFGDNAPRRVVLVDIEPAGLWLCGTALNDALQLADDLTSPAQTFTPVFFPWEQIGFLLDPTQAVQLTHAAAKIAASTLEPARRAGKARSKPSR